MILGRAPSLVVGHIPGPANGGAEGLSGMKRKHSDSGSENIKRRRNCSDQIWELSIF